MSFSRASVILVTAECTTSTGAPLAPRFFTMDAMFFQLGSVETLVPPNLRTIHGECARVTVRPSLLWRKVACGAFHGHWLRLRRQDAWFLPRPGAWLRAGGELWQAPRPRR